MSVSSTSCFDFSKASTINFSPYRHDANLRNDSIICIVEGRGYASGELGFAAFDKMKSTFILSQYTDDLTYSRTINKINIVEPNEIVLLRKKFQEDNELGTFINKNFPSLRLNVVERKVFNSNEELKNILKLCCEQFESVEQDIIDKYYCIAATFFLLNYIESSYNIGFADKSLKLIYSPIEKIMSIDPKTAKALEILSNQIIPTETIFTILNETHTVNGARMLKRSLIEPLTDVYSIKTRTDCVQELVSNPELFDEIESILLKLEKINVTSVVCSFLYNTKKNFSNEEGEKKIDNFMHLKNVLESIDPFRKILKKCENYLFRSYSTQLEDDGYLIMIKIIDSFIKKDCRYNKNNQKRYLKFLLFKEKTFCQIDLIKNLLENDMKKINLLITELKKKYPFSFSFRYNNTRKFYLYILSDDLKNNKCSLPNEFYNVKKIGKTLQFTCEDLDKINFNFEKCLDIFFINCNSILNEPLFQIRKYISCLYKFIDMISMLDLLQSFAKVSAKNNWSKPNFSDNLTLQKSIHPFYQHKEFKTIYNDFHMSSSSNIAIITGPNNSGKTTFIKQIAVCQLLAQIGCFVPCEKSNFTIVDRLLARMGSDNDFDSNSSSFVNELKEISYILSNLTSKSLVVIDELGRGTSAEEGWPFCWAILEKFIDSDDFVLFATHFKELTILAFHYFNVNNYFMETVEFIYKEREMLRFTHKLLEGINKIEGYGVKLAEQTNMPKTIIDSALEIQRKLVTNSSFYKYLNSKVFKKKRLEYEIGKLLIKYNTYKNNSNINYTKTIELLFKEYYKKIEDIENTSDDFTEEDMKSLTESTHSESNFF